MIIFVRYANTELRTLDLCNGLTNALTIEIKSCNFLHIMDNQRTLEPKTFSIVNIIIIINCILFIPWILGYVTGFKQLLGYEFLFGALNIGFVQPQIPSIDNGLQFSYQLLTSVFLHGNLAHLVLNMYALYAFGKPLERRWGSGHFMAFYLTVGVLANVASYLFFRLTGAENVSLIGASGAIYGVLLAFGSYYPEIKVLLFFIIPLKIKWMVPLFAIFELFIEMTGSADGIAHITHLFGFLFAFIYCLAVFRFNAVRQMYFSPLIVDDNERYR